MSRPTHATIHLDALRHNLARVRELAPRSRVMAVVKADGYGHGLERVALALEGADAFGVAALADAERLRSAGLSQRIVLLSGFDEAADLAALRRLNVDPVLHHDSQLALLEQDAASQVLGGANPAAEESPTAERGTGSGALSTKRISGRDSKEPPIPGHALHGAKAKAETNYPLRCWIKLDTGMHRLGFAPERARELRQRLAALPNVAAEPVWMTHFARSDEFGSEVTREQIARFQSARAGLPGEASLANSAAVLGWPDSHGDWIRPGGALYGISVVAGKTGADFGLEPAMSLGTRLIAVNRIRRGEPVGYGGDYRCPEDMPVGVAAIGYGDGYPRHAPSGTPVLVNGRVVPLIGRVSMDLVTLDLRSQPEARVGDAVVLWGKGLPAETVAAAAGTIGYELVCSITRRVRFVESS